LYVCGVTHSGGLPMRTISADGLSGVCVCVCVCVCLRVSADGLSGGGRHAPKSASAYLCLLIYICGVIQSGGFPMRTMGWLRLVGSLKLQVSFAKEPYKRDYILEKRPIVLRRLLIVVTPYRRETEWVESYIHVYSYKRDYILQKRPIVLRKLLIVVPPYRRETEWVESYIHKHQHPICIWCLHIYLCMNIVYGWLRVVGSLKL